MIIYMCVCVCVCVYVCLCIILHIIFIFIFILFIYNNINFIHLEGLSQHWYFPKIILRTCRSCVWYVRQSGIRVLPKLANSFCSWHLCTNWLLLNYNGCTGIVGVENLQKLLSRLLETHDDTMRGFQQHCKAALKHNEEHSNHISTRPYLNFPPLSLWLVSCW
jgi:hypothetical protein